MTVPSLKTTLASSTEHDSIVDALLSGSGPDIEIGAGAHGAGRTMSRTELVEVGARLAQHFRHLGVAPGDTILVGLGTGPALLGTILGAWFADATIACMAPLGPLGRKSLSVPWVKQILDTIRPTVLVAEAPMLNAVRDTGPGQPVLQGPDDLPLGGRAQPDVCRPRADGLAVIQLSSGSTGVPHGIRVTHRALMKNVKAIAERIGVERSDRFLSWLPLHHDMGLVGGLFLPLVEQLPLHLLPTETFVRTPMAWLEGISKMRATLSVAPPFAYSMLGHRVRPSAVRGIDLSSWRVAFVGAETIYAENLSRFVETFGPVGFNARALSPCYGLAEATLAVTMVPHDRDYLLTWADAAALRRDRFEEKAAGAPGALPVVGLGPPVAATELVIADAQGAPLPDGRVGRILVRGPSVTRAIQTPQGIERVADLLDTGDLGFTLDGELFFASRAKDLIIRGGENIAPSELERAADEVDGVRRGSVAAFACLSVGKKRDEIVVVVETRRDSERVRKELAHEVRARIARTAGVQVDEVVIVSPGSVPKTTSGKVQRALCRQLYLDGALRTRGALRLVARVVARAKAFWAARRP